MYVPKIVYPATSTEYKLAQTQGLPVMFIINRTLREGYWFNDWYVYQSSRIYCKCTKVDRVIDRSNPQG